MPKTITDIIPPSRRKAMDAMRPTSPTPSPPPPSEPEEESAGEFESRPPKYPRPMRASRVGFPWKYAIAALVVVVLAGIMLHALGGAKIQITPVIEDMAVSGEFAATGSAGDLSYEIITASTVVSGSVPAEGTEESDDPAQGSITVYNAQATPQQLIKNTRFESPQGLIFRIRDSISVPGGTATKPGELTVTVYADQGGEEYNINPTTFTVPGLKGSATYDLVYARSSEAMTGGFSGMRASVSEATRSTRYDAMKGAIDAELAKALLAEIPEGYILLPGASWTVYEPQPDGVASGTVTLNQKGSITAAVFPKEALAGAIAHRMLEEQAYAGEPVTIESPGTLTVASMSGSAPVAGDTSFSFTVSGNTSLKWLVDKEKIATAVAGKNKNSAQTILSGFPEVGSAHMILRPFWAGEFPDDPAKIAVEVEGEEKE